MDWGDLVSSIRIDLGDNTGTKYSDELLYNYLRSAIWDVSMYYPRRFDHVTLVVSTDSPKKFALPSDFISEIVVECPADNSLSLRRDRPGYKHISGVRPLLYELDGSNLYLDADPGGDAVLLSYYGVHGLPVKTVGEDGTVTYTDGKDPVGEFILTIPDRDLELVTLYMKALVNQRERTKQSLLDRFKPGTGNRQDNPIIMEVEDFFREYRLKLAERSGKTVFMSHSRKYR
jgi:hypothetical protein